VGSISGSFVTAIRKIVLSTAIVAAGFGGAVLVGRPSVSFTPAGATRDDPGPTSQFDAAPPLSIVPGSQRLVPDPCEASVSRFSPTDNSPLKSEPPGETDVALWSTPETTEDKATDAMQPRAMQSREPSPRAKLLNEAPRPLGIGRPAPVTMNRMQSDVALVANVGQVESPIFAPQTSNSVMPAQWSHEELTSTTASAQVNSKSSTAPLPIWPEGNAGEPRSHIVVDGDSLAKLAGRYLDDPRRASEIYEYNRHLLSDPELLPIGIELSIPSRAGTVRDDVREPQSFTPRVVASYSRIGGGLVPVQPIPAVSNMMPRAQLVAPRPAP
jgi:nucleoid-associated protein YgaU